MWDFLKRIGYSTTGFKALFVVACIAVLMLHNFTPENAMVFERLIEFVLGAKAVQYIAKAYADSKKGGSDG